MHGKVFIDQRKGDDAPVETLKYPLDAEYKNLSYLFEGKKVTLSDGLGQLSRYSNLKNPTTTLISIGEPFLYDINSDSKKDVVFLLRTDQDQRVSTTSSYYIALAIALHTGYSGANMLYLDTSIQNPNFLYKNGEIVLEYVRESASTTPKERYFIFKDGILKQLFYN